MAPIHVLLVIACSMCIANGKRVVIDTHKAESEEQVMLFLKDDRQLYVTKDGWVGAATDGADDNTDPARRLWIMHASGTISLIDGRQLYVNPSGWVGVALSGEHTNQDPGRRIWKKHADGTISVADGRQLYVNRQGWVGLAKDGEHTNTDPLRRTWEEGQGCSDYRFPNHARVRGFDLCYSKQSYADAKSGPCESWCTKSVASGDGCNGCCGDIKSKICSEANAPSGYTFLGSGFCQLGYYAGWDAADAVDAATCAAKCDSEPQCWFSSLVLGKSCSRYNSQAGDCLNRPDGRSNHVTYQKAHGGWQLAGNGYCQSSGVGLDRADHSDWLGKKGCTSACDDTVGCNRVIYDTHNGHCYMYSQATQPANCDSNRNGWDYWKPQTNAKTTTTTLTTVTTTTTTSTTRTKTSTTQCEDTSNGATDTGGDGCSDYEVHTEDCFDGFDTDEFTASVMCCACGGGHQIHQP